MHLCHPLVVVHEHVVQRAAGGRADQRHRLRQIFLRQHQAEPRGDLPDQQRDRGMVEAAADRPVGDIDVLVRDVRTPKANTSMQACLVSAELRSSPCERAISAMERMIRQVVTGRSAAMPGTPTKPLAPPVVAASSLRTLRRG